MASRSPSRTAGPTIWSSARSRIEHYRELPDDAAGALVAPGGTLADLKGMWRERRSIPRSTGGHCEGLAMRHDQVRAAPSVLIRKRFQFAGALLIGALLPWLARGPLLPGTMFEPPS